MQYESADPFHTLRRIAIARSQDQPAKRLPVEAEELRLRKEMARVNASLAAVTEELAGARAELAAAHAQNSRLVEALGTVRARAGLRPEPGKPASIVEVQHAFLFALAAEHYEVNGGPYRLYHYTCERRAKHLSRPRQVAMWLCCRLTKASLPQIARAFGGRDHSTVWHARENIERTLAEDPLLQRAANRVLAQFCALEPQQ